MQQMILRLYVIFLGSPDTKAESISEIHILQNASKVFAKTGKDKGGVRVEVRFKHTAPRSPLKEK